MTDEDPQEYGAFRDLCGPGAGKVFIGSSHRLCGFHKLNRNLTNHHNFKGSIAALRNTNVSGGIEFDMIIKWLWSFLKELETEEEANLSMHFFHEYMEEEEKFHAGQMGESLRDKLKIWVSTKFQPQRNKLFAYVYMSVMGFEGTTSSVNEAENRSLKWSHAGPRPCDSLDSSHARIEALSARRDRTKDRQSAVNMGSIPGHPKGRKLIVPELTQYCSELLYKQHSQKDFYTHYMLSPTIFYVRRLYEEGTHESSLETDDSERLYCRIRWVKPSFERTRVIQIITVDGQSVAICKCKFFLRFGFCCRHIYHLLDRDPFKTDASIRWWDVYAFYYGRNNQNITNLLQKL